MRRRSVGLLVWAAPAVVLAIVAAGRTRAPAAQPELVLVRGPELTVRDSTGTERALQRTSVTVFLAYPVWSPDGGRIAYVQESLAAPTSTDWGSDIYVVDAGGGAPRLLWQHDQPAVHLQGMAWVPDGTALLIGYQRYLIEAGRYRGSEQHLDRLDLATGERRRLVDNAIFPSVSADGSRIAYLTADEFGGGGLWVASADGGDARALLEFGDQFLYVINPRIAPDGGAVAFSAVTPPPASRPSGAPLAAGMNASHGAPMDVWTVDVTSGSMTRLTYLNEDDPALAWLPGGGSLVVLATGGLYEVDAGSREARRVGEGSFGGYVDAR